MINTADSMKIRETGYLLNSHILQASQCRPDSLSDGHHHFFDYNNDGLVDIYKANGALKHLYGQEDQVFENIGNGKFKDVSWDLGSYFKKKLVGRGACFGDYDNDGDIDVYIVNLNDQGSIPEK